MRWAESGEKVLAPFFWKHHYSIDSVGEVTSSHRAISKLSFERWVTAGLARDGAMAVIFYGQKRGFAWLLVIDIGLRLAWGSQ